MISILLCAGRKARGLTEHLEGLPDGLLIENMSSRVGVTAVFDALHVLQGVGKDKTRMRLHLPAIWTRESYLTPGERISIGAHTRGLYIP